MSDSENFCSYVEEWLFQGGEAQTVIFPFDRGLSYKRQLNLIDYIALQWKSVLRIPYLFDYKT